MARNKKLVISGYRKNYFDTGIYCFVEKWIDDPRTPEEWWFRLQTLIGLKNGNIHPPMFVDRNCIPIKAEQYKEK